MNFDNVWTHEKLWNKSKLYIQKALSEDREGDMFPFWAAIALEFVARSTLAKVHPVLLADPREGENILYVFGYQKKIHYTPISIPTHSVLERCEVVVPNFTFAEKTFCKEITNRRNEELHSGGIGFDSYPTQKWLSKYYKTVKILLDFQDKTLVDFLGSAEAYAAEEMIKDRDITLEKSTKDKISYHKKCYESLSTQVQQEKVISSKNIKWTVKGSYKKDEICPACNEFGVVTGKLISMSDIKWGEIDITQNLNVLPTDFRCFCCDLELKGHLELDVVEMGGNYKIEEIFDPKEYYDSQDHEPDFDYGND